MCFWVRPRGEEEVWGAHPQKPLENPPNLETMAQKSGFPVPLRPLGGGGNMVHSDRTGAGVPGVFCETLSPSPSLAFGNVPVTGMDLGLARGRGSPGPRGQGPPPQGQVAVLGSPSFSVAAWPTPSRGFPGQQRSRPKDRWACMPRLRLFLPFVPRRRWVQAPDGECAVCCSPGDAGPQPFPAGRGGSGSVRCSLSLLSWAPPWPP